MYENNHMAAFWDVPAYADQKEVRATRLDARIVDRERRRMTLLEMGCCWVENYQQKEEEKTLKCAPLCMELKRQHPGFEIIIIYCNNIVIDVLGGYSKGLRDNMTSVVVEERGKQMLRRMQKAVLHVTSSLNNERSLF